MPKVASGAPPVPADADTAGAVAEAQAATKAVKATAKKATAARKAPERRDPLAEAKPLDDVLETVNILYSGDGGTGKTTDLMAMANLGPIIVVNAEGGIKRRALERMGINTANIRVVPEDPSDLTFDYMEDLFWSLLAKLKAEPGSIVGTVWDSVTEIHKRMLMNVVAYQNSKAERTGKSRTKDSEPGDMQDRFFIDRSDYGVMTEQMRQLIAKYRDLPCHFGISSLLRREQDDDGRVVYRPAVNPALQIDIHGFMDIVGVTQVKEVGGEEEYQAIFRPSGKYRGKDRFKALPKGLVDPTFDRIFAYVTEQITLEDDPVMVAARERREHEVEGIDLDTAVQGEVDTEHDDEDDTAS